MIRKFESDNELTPSYIISYTADVTEKAAQLLLSRGTNEIMSKPPPKGFLADISSRFKMMWRWVWLLCFSRLKLCRLIILICLSRSKLGTSCTYDKYFITSSQKLSNDVFFFLPFYLVQLRLVTRTIWPTASAVHRTHVLSARRWRPTGCWGTPPHKSSHEIPRYRYVQRISGAPERSRYWGLPYNLLKYKSNSCHI